MSGIKSDAEYFAEAMREIDALLGHDTRQLVFLVERGPLGWPIQRGWNLTGWSRHAATLTYRHTSGVSVDELTVLRSPDPQSLLERLATDAARPAVSPEAPHA